MASSEKPALNIDGGSVRHGLETTSSLSDTVVNVPCKVDGEKVQIRGQIK